VLEQAEEEPEVAEEQPDRELPDAPTDEERSW